MEGMTAPSLSHEQLAIVIGYLDDNRAFNGLPKDFQATK